MDVQFVRSRIAHIVAESGDDEVAHGLEDDLHREFIAFVAAATKDSDPVLSRMAKLIAGTSKIDFCRWCA